MTIPDLLQSIGLTDKETVMYMALLRNGTQPTSHLARKAHLNRGTAYVVLHSLLEKGLIVKSVKRNVQYFSPLDPTQIVAFLDHRAQEITSARQNVQSMLGQITAIMNPLTSKPKIEYFDGPEGARFVLEQTLLAKDLILRSFLSIADISEFTGADFFNHYTQKRIQKGYELHVIRTLEKDRQALSRDPFAKHYISSRKDKRKIRYIPDELAFPITLYMFDSRIAVISSKDEGFSLLIESRELSTMLKKLFDFIWKSLR